MFLWTGVWSTYALHLFQQEQREREKQDLELAKEMAEDDDDFPWIQSFCCQP